MEMQLVNCPKKYLWKKVRYSLLIASNILFCVIKSDVLCPRNSSLAQKWYTRNSSLDHFIHLQDQWNNSYIVHGKASSLANASMNGSKTLFLVLILTVVFNDLQFYPHKYWKPQIIN